MEEVQHRLIWARVFATVSVFMGVAGFFCFGVTSFVGIVVGFAAIKEKALGRFWYVSAWVGTLLCVAYFFFVFALGLVWYE